MLFAFSRGWHSFYDYLAARGRLIDTSNRFAENPNGQLGLQSSTLEAVVTEIGYEWSSLTTLPTSPDVLSSQSYVASFL